MRTFLFKFLMPILALVFGVMIGVLIRDFPKFHLVYELKITDVIGNIATIGVGVFVPLIVKKIIDDTRSIKSVLVNEVDNYYQNLSNIYSVFDQCYENNSITRKNKDNIAALLETLDAKFEQVKKMLGNQYQKNADSELNAISEHQNRIWKLLTSHSLTAESVGIINQTIYDEAQRLNSDFRILIVNLKNRIHSL